MSVGAVMTLMLQLSCYCLKHGVLQPIENEFDKWRAAVLTIIGAGNLIMFSFVTAYYITLTTHFASYAGLMADARSCHAFDHLLVGACRHTPGVQSFMADPPVAFQLPVDEPALLFSACLWLPPVSGHRCK